jgi:hypothetical protein
MPDKVVLQRQAQDLPGHQARGQLFADVGGRGGYQVGELAKCQFSEGVEVEATDHQSALAQTKRLLQQDRAVVFEAAVAFCSPLTRRPIWVLLSTMSIRNFNKTHSDFQG